MSSIQCVFSNNFCEEIWRAGGAFFRARQPPAVQAGWADMKPVRPLAFIRLPALCACLLMLAAPAWALPDREIAGREAAEVWLALVDGGKYAESWQAAAPLFRSSIPEQKWTELMKQVRTPLGAVESRKLKALFYTDALPEAPPGEFVVVQFETKFAGREDTALETVTPMLDPETGAWQVCGYYIK